MSEDTIKTKKHNISIREMPVDLWSAFRIHCIDSGLTVEDEVINALNEYLTTRMAAKKEEQGATQQAAD